MNVIKDSSVFILTDSVDFNAAIFFADEVNNYEVIVSVEYKYFYD